MGAQTCCALPSISVPKASVVFVAFDLTPLSERLWTRPHNVCCMAHKGISGRNSELVGKVKGHQNLITCMIHHNTYSCQ